MAMAWLPQDKLTCWKVMEAVTSKAKSPITDLDQDMGDVAIQINIGDIVSPADVKYSVKHAGVGAIQGFFHYSC